MKDAKPEKLIKLLKAQGFTEHNGGKHRAMVKMVDGVRLRVNVPYHGIIKRNTVDSIRKQAGIDKKVFYSYSL